MAIFSRRRPPPPKPSFLRHRETLTGLWTFLPGWARLVLIALAVWGLLKVRDEALKKWRARQAAARALEERRRAGIPDSDTRPFRIAKAAVVEAQLAEQAQQHQGVEFGKPRPRVGSFSAYGAPSTGNYRTGPSFNAYRSSSSHSLPRSGSLGALPRSSSSASKLSRLASHNAAVARRSRIGEDGLKRRMVAGIDGKPAGEAQEVDKVSRWRDSVEASSGTSDGAAPRASAPPRVTLKRSAPSYAESLSSLAAGPSGASRPRDPTSSAPAHHRVTKKPRPDLGVASSPVAEQTDNKRLSLPGSLEGSVTLDEDEDQMEVDETPRKDKQPAQAKRKAKDKGKKREIDDVSSVVGGDAEGSKRTKANTVASRDFASPLRKGVAMSKDAATPQKAQAREADTSVDDEAADGSVKVVTSPSPKRSKKDKVKEKMQELADMSQDEPGSERISIFGERYRVGEEGVRQKLVRIRVLRKRYNMPADSEHADREAETEALEERWVTEKEHDRLEALNRLEGQTGSMLDEPEAKPPISPPASATKIRATRRDPDTVSAPTSPRAHPRPAPPSPRAHPRPSSGPSSTSSSLAGSPAPAAERASRPRNSLGRMRIVHAGTPRRESAGPGERRWGVERRTPSPEPEPEPEPPKVEKGKQVAAEAPASDPKPNGAAFGFALAAPNSEAAAAVGPPAFSFASGSSSLFGGVKPAEPATGIESPGTPAAPSLFSRLGGAPQPQEPISEASKAAEPPKPPAFSFTPAAAKSESTKPANEVNAPVAAKPAFSFAAPTPAAPPASSSPFGGSPFSFASKPVIEDKKEDKAMPTPGTSLFGGSGSTFGEATPASSQAPAPSGLGGSGAFAFGGSGASKPSGFGSAAASTAAGSSEKPAISALSGGTEFPAATSKKESVSQLAAPVSIFGGSKTAAPASVFGASSTPSFSLAKKGAEPAPTAAGDATSTPAPAKPPAAFSFGQPTPTAAPAASAFSLGSSKTATSAPNTGLSSSAFSFGSKETAAPAPSTSSSSLFGGPPAGNSFGFKPTDTAVVQTTSSAASTPAPDAGKNGQGSDAESGTEDGPHAAPGSSTGSRGRRTIAGSGRRLLSRAMGGVAQAPAPSSSIAAPSTTSVATSAPVSAPLSFSFSAPATTAASSTTATPSSSGFSFGGSSAPPANPAFGSGSSAFSTSPAANLAPHSIATPQASNPPRAASVTPSFSFGSASNIPGPSASGSTAPSFSFGSTGGASPQPSAFSFGAPGASTAPTSQAAGSSQPPSFMFTAPSPQPPSQ